MQCKYCFVTWTIAVLPSHSLLGFVEAVEQRIAGWEIASARLLEAYDVKSIAWEMHGLRADAFDRQVVRYELTFFDHSKSVVFHEAN